MSLAETPWVDRNLNEVWERLVQVVPASWLPMESLSPAGQQALRKGKRIVFQELGCGHYGCVMPTGEPDLVFKLTSDVTEARFVSLAMQLDWPEGIVKYKKLLELPDLSHRRRPLFVLWREAAKDVGVLGTASYRQSWVSVEDQLAPLGFQPWQARPIKEGVRLLSDFRDVAARARNAFRDLIKRTSLPPDQILTDIWNRFDESTIPIASYKHARSIHLIVTHLRKCYGFTQELSNTDVVNYVGEAMMHYMDHGILLADVHLNNIGRNMQDTIVITDPGHAMVFHPRWYPPPRIERL